LLAHPGDIGVFVALSWKSKVEVVSTLGHNVLRQIEVDWLGNSTCLPWIKLTVGENNLGVRLVVLQVVVSSESSERPFVLWGQSVFFLAFSGIGIIIKFSLVNEHGLVASSGNRHGKLITSKHIPAITIEISSGIGIRVVGASKVSRVVEINLSGVVQGSQDLFLSII